MSSSKKLLYYDQAERYYVIEQCTINEISSRLPISEKTIRNWKEEGHWNQKRRQYLDSKKAFHEELYQFARQLMSSIRTDMSEGRKVDSGRLYTFTRLLPLIVKVKDYEETIKSDKEKEEISADDLIEIIQKEVLNIEK